MFHKILNFKRQKKIYKPKYLSAIPKNLNWKILAKTLVTFKGSENVYIIVIFQFLGEGGHKKKQLYIGNCLKRVA